MGNGQQAIGSFTAKMRKAFEALNEDQRGILCEEADATCTNGYDNDGSTGFEIFENGFDLAVKAAGRDVWAHDDEEGTTVFLIGTPEEVVARIEKVAEENPSEDL
jgi:alkanesulfonate monooxygenase SsuD/methylene tetrahydromethanopterin reductase-like flavin-dependent oxidoreductase (luciferase family)